MNRGLLKNQRGTAAIEFAIIAPVLMFVLLGAIEFSLAFWSKNALQAAAEQTSRCVAINSVICASVSAGCDSLIAAQCYAELIAKQRGVSNVTAGEVAINTANIVSGVSFTTVTITYPFLVIGYSLEMIATASFPNKV